MYLVVPLCVLVYSVPGLDGKYEF